MPRVRSHDGVELHYDLHDSTNPWEDAPTALLQHGFGRSGRFWFGTVPHLARFYRLICPDFRGLGQSSADFDPAAGITVDNYLRDIETILDHAGVETVHYVGESIGGTVGYAFAATRPARLRTLSVLASPIRINEWMREAYAAGHPSWPEAIETLGSDGWARATNTAARFPTDMDPRFLDWYSRGVGQSPTPVLAAMARLALGVELEPLLPRIQTPLLAVFPSAGRIATTEQEETLRRLVPNVHTVRLPNVHTVRLRTGSHMIQFMEPGACARLVLSFLALHDGRACDE